MIPKKSIVLKSLPTALVLTFTVNSTAWSAEKIQASSSPAAATSKQSGPLFKYRQLAKSNPIEALKQIDLAILEQPSNPELQKFRWYLAEVTGRNVEVLAKQRKDYDKCHDLWLGKFHIMCLYCSEHTNDCRVMARMLADEHPFDESVVCLNAWVVSCSGGDCRKALSTVRALLNKQQSPRLLGWQAFLLGATGEVLQARSLFERDEATCGNNVSWLLSKYAFYNQLSESAHLARAALSKLETMNPTSLDDTEERMRRLLFLNSQNKKLIENDWIAVNKRDSVPEMSAPRMVELQLQIALCDGDQSKVRQSIQKLKSYNNWHAMYHIGYSQPDGSPFWAKSISLNPGQASSYYCRAGDARNWKTKVDILTKHLCYRRVPGYINSRATHMETAGRFSEAERDWALSYELQPINLDTLRHLCFCKSKTDKAAAIAFIESECKKHPGDVRLQIVKAETLLGCGNTEAAQKTIDYIRSMPYPKVEKTLLLGKYLELHGSEDDAPDLYKKALDEKGDQTPIHLAIASGFCAGKPQTCLESCNWLYTKHPEHSPERSAAIYCRSVAFYTQNKFKEALEQLALGKKNFPDNSTWDYSMLTMMTDSDAQAAKELCEQGIKRHPREQIFYKLYYAIYSSKCKHSEAAIKMYEEAIRCPGFLRENWAGESEILAQLGRQNEAIAKATEGIEATEYPIVYIARAKILKQQKRYSEAVRDIEIAIDRVNPASNDAYALSVLSAALCERIELCRLSGNNTKAIECLEIGQRLSPGNRYWIDAMFTGLDASDSKLAKELYERWRDPNRITNCDLAYGNYLRTNQFAKDALVIFQRLNKKTPNDLEQRKITASLAQEADQPELALQELTYICSKLKPNDEWSWVQKIRLLDHLGRKEEATSAIERALANTNTTDTFLLMRADLRERKRADRIADVARVCRLNPGNSDAWVKLSEMMPTIKEKRKALDEGIKCNPNSVKLLLARVELCVKNDPAVSLNDINKVLKLDNESNFASAKKAEILQSLQRHREAIGIYKRLLETEHNRVYLKKYISCQLAAGMYSEALAECNKVLATEPKNPIAWELKLCALNLMGRTAQFDSDMALVSKLVPSITRSEIKLTCLMKYQQGEVSEFISVIKEAKNETLDRKATLKKLVEREVDFVKRTRHLMELAEIATARGQYKEAIGYYNKAILCEPSNHQLYLKRASAFYGAKDIARAKQDRRMALELYRKSSAAKELSTK